MEEEGAVVGGRGWGTREDKPPPEARQGNTHPKSLPGDSGQTS